MNICRLVAGTHNLPPSGGFFIFHLFLYFDILETPLIHIHQDEIIEVPLKREDSLSCASGRRNRNTEKTERDLTVLFWVAIKAVREQGGQTAYENGEKIFRHSAYTGADAGADAGDEYKGIGRNSHI